MPNPQGPMRLNLGCGRVKRQGYLNVDYVGAPGVDLVLDLNRIPYPLRDASVDEIYCSHVLEHLDDPFWVLREWHRILKPGGTAEIIVPHRKSRGAFMVTHKTYFDEYSLAPVAAGPGPSPSLEDAGLFTILVVEKLYSVLSWPKLTYHLHRRLPWSRRIPLGRVLEVRWILAKNRQEATETRALSSGDRTHKENRTR